MLHTSLEADGLAFVVHLCCNSKRAFMIGDRHKVIFSSTLSGSRHIAVTIYHDSIFSNAVAFYILPFIAVLVSGLRPKLPTQLSTLSYWPRTSERRRDGGVERRSGRRMFSLQPTLLFAVRGRPRDPLRWMEPAAAVCCSSL